MCIHAMCCAIYLCQAFVLEPLESVEIAISFEPDFTSALVSDVLTVDSSLGRLSFPLTATMPFALLPICQVALCIHACMATWSRSIDVWHP